MIGQSRRVAAVDIGGSGCRAAWVEVRRGGDHRVGDISRLAGVSSRSNLARAVSQALGPFDRLGISTAGFVNGREGVVDLCRVQPWFDGRTRERLEACLPRTRVTIVNDGEAHLLAHVGAIRLHPTICLSLGTSVGFGMTDEGGKTVRPRSDTNWDIGAIRLRSGASLPEVWWALGSHGLTELQQNLGHDSGVEHYGYRLGGFIRDLSIMFRPRTVVVGGGIMHRYQQSLLRAVGSELKASIPSYMPPPVVIASQYDDASGLVGAAVAASDMGGLR